MANNIKANVKTLLDLQDNRQDETLDIIIKNVKSHLKVLIGDEIPEDLDFIVEEITIRRYNRIGSEGMQSESVEGHSMNFYDLKDEFVPYAEIIQAYKKKPSQTMGKVLFL